jgi:hypothetical protein
VRVFVVIGRLSAIPAGYNLLGVCETEVEAEGLKTDREKNPGLAYGQKWEAIDIWDTNMGRRANDRLCMASSK